MNGVFNITQITQGKSLDDWYQPATHLEEKTVSTRKTKNPDAPTAEKILSLFKPGAWLKKAQIASALGVSPDTLTWHIGKLLVDKALIAQGNTGNRVFALPGTEPSATAPKANGSKKPKAAVKKVKFKRLALPPKAETPAAKAAPCNVRDFTAALTADRRLVIIGASEPLIFSAEQTLGIAALISNYFGA